jgi:hypothetical protein
MSKEARSDSLLPEAHKAARRTQPSPTALTATSWSAPGELPVVDWVEQGRWLGAVGRASGWWIGDWIRYGNVRYGEKYGEAARLTGYDCQSLMNMAYVAGRYEAPRRRESLSFSHHAELAALAPPDQDLWLDRVEAGALSVRALRFELREARQRVALRRARATRRLTPVSGHRPAAARSDLEAQPELRCPHCGHRFGRAAETSRRR